MSDQSAQMPTAPEVPEATLAAPANAALANATQALAVKELGDAVGGLKKQVKKLWIAVAILGVLVLAVGTVSFVPSLRFGLSGRPNFQNGQFRSRPNGTSGTFQAPSNGTSTNQ